MQRFLARFPRSSVISASGSSRRLVSTSPAVASVPATSNAALAAPAVPIADNKVVVSQTSANPIKRGTTLFQRLRAFMWGFGLTAAIATYQLTEDIAYLNGLIDKDIASLKDSVLTKTQ